MASLATIDSVLPVLQPGPATSFPLPLKVFISYKQKDVAAAECIRQQLEKIGGSNGIEVFVSGDDHVIKAGQDWRRVVLQNLREAHVLIFLYTDPSLHWDWCLYETGYFDGRQDPQQLDRRLYLLHHGDVSPVGPFLGLKTVPVLAKDDPDDKQLKSFLQLLFVDTTEPPVNRNWNKPDCGDLLAAFKAPFGDTILKPVPFIRRLTFQVAKGPATVESLQAGRIPADAKVNGTEESFGLFNFRTDAERPWQELESQWRQEVPPPPDAAEADPVMLWVGNLAGKMLAAMRGQPVDDGLPLFYCPFKKSERALFRPSLAQMTEHASAIDFDVVFVDMAEEVSARSAGPLTTVGILLRLSHMFRFGWIEPMDRALVNARPNDLLKIKVEIMRRLNSITAESFNQGLRTEAAVLQAFKEGCSLRDQAQSAMNAWKEKVTPIFDRAMKETDPEAAVALLRDVLKQASAVNWQFHRACASRYAQLVDEYAMANKEPGDLV